jgi:hypothetical protein
MCQKQTWSPETRTLEKPNARNFLALPQDTEITTGEHLLAASSSRWLRTHRDCLSPEFTSIPRLVFPKVWDSMQELDKHRTRCSSALPIRAF